MLSAGCVICQVMKDGLDRACSMHGSDMYKNLTERLEGRSLTNVGTYGTGSYNV